MCRRCTVDPQSQVLEAVQALRRLVSPDPPVCSESGNVNSSGNVQLQLRCRFPFLIGSGGAGMRNISICTAGPWEESPPPPLLCPRGITTHRAQEGGAPRDERGIRRFFLLLSHLCCVGSEGVTQACSKAISEPKQTVHDPRLITSLPD